jgi:hypothetical protein
MRALAALPLLALLAACASGGGSASAPAAAPAASATATAAATATADSVDFTGDWEFAAQLQGSTLEGVWRATYNNGRYSGIVAVAGKPTMPLASFTPSGRRVTLSFEMNAEIYTIAATAENVRTANGTVTYRGGMGRLRAQKRI